MFLNHGSFGACPRAVLEEQSRLRALLESDPMDFFFVRGPKLWQEALASLSRFLTADPGGMTFQFNATAGVNTVLRSLSFGPDDEILVLDQTYQACRNAVDFAASRCGAKVVTARVPFPPADEDEIVASVMAAASGRTRLALIDTVTSPTALRLPFERLTRELQERDIDVLIDAAHGPGLLPLDLGALGAAYVTGNCHKWLCTPKGSGFLHIRADRRHLLQPLVVSHGYSADLPADHKFREQFDWQGTQDISPWLCIPKAIEFVGGLLPGGWPEVMARNHALAVQARDTLADALGIRQRVPEAQLAAMATLDIPPDAPLGGAGAVLQRDPLGVRLHEEFGIQVIVFSWKPHGRRCLRVSAALYNTIDEYHFLAEVLQHTGMGAPTAAAAAGTQFLEGMTR